MHLVTCKLIRMAIIVTREILFNLELNAKTIVYPICDDALCGSR